MKTDAKITAKPKPKFSFYGDENTKLSVQVKQKTFTLIDDYRKFHKEISGEAVSLDTLISAIITSGITSDKTFIKWRKDRHDAQTAVTKPEAKTEEKFTRQTAKENNSSENIASDRTLFPVEEQKRGVNLQN